MKSESKQLIEKINSLSLKLATLKGVKQRIQTQTNDLKTKIENDILLAQNKKDAHLLLLGFISQRRETAISSIENTGTYALRAICGDDYKVHFLRNEEKKNSAAFKMEIGIESDFNGEKIITGLKDERGGGVTEATSWGLRLAAMDWLNYDGPVLLDESFKSVSSDEKSTNVGRLLASYCEKKQRQILFATHKTEIFEEFADHIVHVRKENGVSKVKII